MNRRIALRTRTRGRGFSLAELAVVLVIVGAIGLLIWQVLPRYKSLPAIERLTATSLPDIEAALNGFVLARGRLPCPATTGTGLEDCSTAPLGTAASPGWLPAKTLGLSLSEPVRYLVYRNATGTGLSGIPVDLAVSSSLYTPRLPPGTVADPNPGLGFCQELLTLVRAATPPVALTAGVANVPIAYGLATAGPGDADGNGNPFDGLNTTAGQFELTGAARSATYDDQTLTIGSSEMFTRLGCATKLAAVNGAAHAASAAYDLDQFALRFVAFRTFQLAFKNQNVVFATDSVTFAGIDMGIALATLADSIALSSYPPFASGAALVISMTAAIAAATATLTVAIISLVSANADVVTATNQLAAATAFELLTAADQAVAILRAQTLNSRGLSP